MSITDKILQDIQSDLARLRADMAEVKAEQRKQGRMLTTINRDVLEVRASVHGLDLAPGDMDAIRRQLDDYGRRLDALEAVK
jgi:hypothetical protein